MQMKYWILVLFIVGASLAFAETKPEKVKRDCFPEAELDSLHATIDLQTTNPKITDDTVDFCDMTASLPKTYAALSFLKMYAQFPAPAAGSADQNILGSNVWSFFSSRIQKIIFTADGEGLCGETTNGLSFGAYVDPNSDPHTAHVCDAIGKWDLLTVVATLVHEARHTNGFEHVDCSRGPFTRATGSCDDTYSRKGAYAVGVEYKIKLSQNEKVDPILRAGARSLAVADLFSRFNEVPFGFKEMAVLQDQRGGLHSFDGRSLTQLSEGSLRQILTDRYGSPTVFDPDLGKVKSYFLSEAIDTSGEIANTFRASSASAKKDLIDVLYIDEYCCFVSQQGLLCTSNSVADIGKDTDAHISLSRIHPLGFVYMSKSSLLKNQVPYLVGDDGYLYEMPKTFAELQNATEADFRPSSRPRDLLKVAAVSNNGNEEYVLSREGQLLVTTKGEKGLKPILLPNIRFRSLVSPVIWSNRLHDL